MKRIKKKMILLRQKKKMVHETDKEHESGFDYNKVTSDQVNRGSNRH